MLYLQIASPKSSVLNFLDSNSFEVIISIFQRTEKVPDMERLRHNGGSLQKTCTFAIQNAGFPHIFKDFQPMKPSVFSLAALTIGSSHTIGSYILL